ncbi:GPI ethanolamine phosphate transferase 1 [Lucilia sericata]|uniref:GPI ethanolamine phosphate transferase 1 n=1 Tax=Lucilia sericata TaxID=13632 RepID=UPI0018A843CD|nr:GPI ethanolamine phosphate transferase 1 [Lucilia sericata]
MWIIYSIIIHILLLGSIFVIYFRSPVITNLQPYKNIPLEAPAKRLVLIVTDGLRAESFYHDNFKNVPHIKHLIDNQKGIYGISKTRVPTESRPGHIALIAGLYEDPSAVTRGWKENPIEFDTVFNRSSKTYAWGANDVLHIFSRLSREDEKRLFFDSYNHELDFSGKEKTYELDKWVFDKVEKFLQRKKAELQPERQVIYFLHLLGLDTAGHVYKPNTKLFLENLHYTDRGIKEMYELFERTFPDGKTAYVLTSDHGMTDAGSHGAGANYETETPFFIWGAGVKHKPYNSKRNSSTLYELEQAEMAPIMSALLGIATPMNNFGVLPKDIINASELYLLHATQSNAHQLYNQYKSLLQEHEKGLFNKFLPQFKMDIDFEEYLVTQNSYETEKLAIYNSYKLMYSSLKGIDYYFSYYRELLLAATTATFIVWLGYLLKLLGHVNTAVTRQSKKSNFAFKFKVFLLSFLALITFIFCLLQKLSWSITFYLMLPFVVASLFITKRCPILLFDNKLGLTKFHLLLLLLCAELLVYTFFDRRAISLGFLVFALQDKISWQFFKQKLKFYISFILSLILCIFPLLPISVGYSNNVLLYAGILVTLLRPFLVKNSISILDKLIVFIALVNNAICVYMHSQQLGVSVISHIISWLYLLYVFISLVKPYSLTLKQRLEKFIFLLTSLYCLFCTSYESLFILLLISELILSLDCSLSHNNFNTPLSPITSTLHISHCFRLAFIILLYTFFSFFGSGNIASVSSFDPNIIRCFLATFSPFIIMFLVILKLIIPILLIISIIFALTPLALQYERQIFICLLIVCDIMGLNFLFLVKNQGSWLEIGTSISHFVIMQVTTLVLVLFVNLAKFLLKIKVSSGFEENFLKLK